LQKLLCHDPPSSVTTSDPPNACFRGTGEWRNELSSPQEGGKE
jgi:hypothetical protein